MKKNKSKPIEILLKLMLIMALYSFSGFAIAQATTAGGKTTEETGKDNLSKKVGKYDRLLSTLYIKSHFSLENTLLKKEDRIKAGDQLGFGISYRRQIHRGFTQKFMPVYWLSDTSIYVSHHFYQDIDIKVIHIHQTINRQIRLNSFFSGYAGLGPSLFIPVNKLDDIDSDSSSLKVDGGLHVKAGFDIRVFYPNISLNIESSIWYGFNTKKYSGTTISTGLGYIF